MRAETVSQLLDINRLFYQQFGRAFAATRQRLQPGVSALLSRLPLQGRWLDLGCGSGELARELRRRGFRGSYLGLDFSRELIEEARKENGETRELPHPLAPSPRSGEGGRRENEEANGQWRGEGGRRQEGEQDKFYTPKIPPIVWEKVRRMARQMRNAPTEAEEALWQQLRNRRLLDLKFRRQHSVDLFILDFYCSELGFGIEVDGPIHQYSQEEDALRTQFLELMGLKMIRFTNEQVLHNMPQVEAEIKEVTSLLRQRPAVNFPPPPLSNLTLVDSSAPPPHLVGRGPGGEVQRESYQFALCDLSSPDWSAPFPSASFDTLLAFASLHHLPGTDLRKNVLLQARRLLPPGGQLIHSEWQFQHSPRLLERVQPWERIGLSPSEVDPGDYLLDWRYALPGQAEGVGLRYVHLYTLDELALLAQECGFDIQETFESDGHGGRLGLYQVWQAI